MEHAGCLACLQYCLVHRVSPCGDPTLSPGRLRVLAWVRYSTTVLQADFWLPSLWSRASRDCAVLRGRTQFILGGVQIGAILEDSGRRIEQGASPCLLEIFGREGVPILEVIIQHQRGPWEDSVDPQGRHFRRSSISETLSGLFWVL